jgi:hypothetical protein
MSSIDHSLIVAGFAAGMLAIAGSVLGTASTYVDDNGEGIQSSNTGNVVTSDIAQQLDASNISVSTPAVTDSVAQPTPKKIFMHGILAIKLAAFVIMVVIFMMYMFSKTSGMK